MLTPQSSALSTAGMFGAFLAHSHSKPQSLFIDYLDLLLDWLYASQVFCGKMQPKANYKPLQHFRIQVQK